MTARSVFRDDGFTQIKVLFRYFRRTTISDPSFERKKRDLLNSGRSIDFGKLEPEIFSSQIKTSFGAL